MRLLKGTRLFLIFTWQRCAETGACVCAFSWLCDDLVITADIPVPALSEGPGSLALIYTKDTVWKCCMSLVRVTLSGAQSGSR